MTTWAEIIQWSNDEVEEQVKAWVAAGGKASDLTVLMDLGTRWAEMFERGPIGFRDPPKGCEVVEGRGADVVPLCNDRQVVSLCEMDRQQDRMLAQDNIFRRTYTGDCPVIDWNVWLNLHKTRMQSRGTLHPIWGFDGELHLGCYLERLFSYLVFRRLGLKRDRDMDTLVEAVERGYCPIGRRGDRCLLLRVPAQALDPAIPERPRRGSRAGASAIDPGLVGEATDGVLYVRNRVFDNVMLPLRLREQVAADKRFVRQRQVRHRARVFGQDRLMTEDAEWAIRTGRTGVGTVRIQVMREPGGDLDVWQVVGEPSAAERQVLAELCTYAGARLTADLPYHEEGRWGAEDGPAAPKPADWDAERCVLRRGRPRRHSGLVPLVDQYPAKPAAARPASRGRKGRSSN